MNNRVKFDGGSPGLTRGQWFGMFVLVLVLGFGGVWGHWLVQAWQVPLHSHVVLIPLVSGWLLRQRRADLPQPGRAGWAGVAAGLGLAAICFAMLARMAGRLSADDRLALQVTAFLGLLVAGGSGILGGRWMRAAAFPFGFLVFMIPLPDGLTAAIERGLMRASAALVHRLFEWSGIPVFRDGQVLQIPGMTLEVVQECSGIRSTWVLLITAVLAAHLFLVTPWRRVLFVAVVLPLGILRNATRILVLGLLCVHVGPEMIDSWIHHQGGPVFFVAALVPLLVLAWWLRRGELRAARRRVKNHRDDGGGQAHNLAVPHVVPDNQ